MSDLEKSYSPKKFRRKIPKVGRSYKRHQKEKKTFDKSEDINDLVEEIINEHIKKSQENNMSIENEIDQEAEKMAKSTNSTKEILISTIKELGIEGLKKSLAENDMTESQRDLLKSVLEEMKVEKAVSMDSNYSPDRKFITEENMGTEVESGSDDEDEKLVLTEAAQHNHQGDRSPEGIDDHIIKSLSEELECEEDLVKGLFYKPDSIKEMKTEDTKDSVYYDLKRCVNQIMSMKEDVGEIRYTIEKEIPEAKVVFEAKYNAKLAEAKKLIKKYSSMKKSNDIVETAIDEALSKSRGNITPEELEALKKGCNDSVEKGRGKDLKPRKTKDGVPTADSPGKNSMDPLIKPLKSGQKKKLNAAVMALMNKKKEVKKSELIEMKNEIIKSYEDANLPYTVDLIKSTLKEKLTKSEDEPIIEPVKKSIVFERDENSLLKANTLGRNFHYSINDHYDEALAKSKEQPEDLKKSDEDKDAVLGINDLIEKSMDLDYNGVKTDQIFKSQSKGEHSQGSFSDEDLAKSMNMTVEKMENILGK